MSNFNLKKYLAEKRLLKENFGNPKNKKPLKEGELEVKEIDNRDITTTTLHFSNGDHIEVNPLELLENNLENSGQDDIAQQINKLVNQEQDEEVKESELKEESGLKFSQVKEGKIYTTVENFGIFQEGDKVMVDSVSNIGQEVVLELKNTDGENDSIKGDLSEPVEVFK